MYKITNISAAMRPSVSNLVPNQCLDIIRLPLESKGANIRNAYNQVPHLTQDTNEKVTNLHIYTTNESPGVSPFPAGDHEAQTNRRAHRHNKHKTEKNP